MALVLSQILVNLNRKTSLTIAHYKAKLCTISYITCQLPVHTLWLWHVEMLVENRKYLYLVKWSL